jgi:GxxExxY protein
MDTNRIVSSRKDAKAQRTPLDIKENKIAKQVVDAAYQIHSKIGPGLFESVYEVLLAHELIKRGFVIERQKLIPILYNGLVFDEGFRADLVVEDLIILELKSVETILPVHKKQLLTYLRLTDKKLGLLINFGSALIKNGIFRIVNNL